MATYSLDFRQCRLPAYQHQKVGVVKIFQNPYFFLADEMGAGKTKQTIDAAQFLFQFGFIKKVVIVAPASVRSVWFDPILGELAKHLWESQKGLVMEYHAKSRTWFYGGAKRKNDGLQWLITNYDFIRPKERLKELALQCDEDTLLVLDESSAIKNPKAKQSQSVMALRAMCGRVLLLNGTPISNNPGDLYNQAQTMHRSILGCKTWFHFRARYGVMGGWQNKQVVSWINLDDLQRRMNPYILRRLKVDCLDLPAKLPPVTILVPMTPKLWKIYKEMRDELVAWLSEADVSMAPQAIVKAIRLAQITSGFLGGVEDQSQFDDVLEDGKELPPVIKTEEVGREKLESFLSWYGERLEEEPHFKLLVWCRFKPEVHRLAEEVKKCATTLQVGKIVGGQKRSDRDYALRLLDPRTAPVGPAIVVGTPSSGSMGLNLTAAHTVVYLSNDYSLKTRLQSEDRVHRPGQTKPVSYFDFIATGPDGQKTIDHNIIKALRSKEDLATRTTSAWVDILKEE